MTIADAYALAKSGDATEDEAREALGLLFSVKNASGSTPAQVAAADAAIKALEPIAKKALEKQTMSQTNIDWKVALRSALRTSSQPSWVANLRAAFCPTGRGGGQDNSCAGKGGGGGGNAGKMRPSKIGGKPMTTKHDRANINVALVAEVPDAGKSDRDFILGDDKFQDRNQIADRMWARGINTDDINKTFTALERYDRYEKANKDRKPDLDDDYIEPDRVKKREKDEDYL